MKKSVKGFLLAPFVPGLVFVFVAAGLGIILLLFTGKWSDLLDIPLILFGSFFWLFFALPVSYFFSFLFGIPMYFIFKKIGLFNFKSYVVGSSISGIISGLLPALYFYGDSFQMKIIYVIGGGIFGGITGYSFWSIVYGSPKNIFNRFFKSE